MSKKLDPKVSVAQHVAETHRNKVRNVTGTVITGDVVSGVVNKDGDENVAKEDSQDEPS